MEARFKSKEMRPRMKYDLYAIELWITARNETAKIFLVHNTNLDLLQMDSTRILCATRWMSPKKARNKYPKIFTNRKYFSQLTRGTRGPITRENGTYSCISFYLSQIAVFLFLSVADCRVSLGSLLSSELSVTVDSGRRIYQWMRMPRTITLDS